MLGCHSVLPGFAQAGTLTGSLEITGSGTTFNPRHKTWTLGHSGKTALLQSILCLFCE